MITDIKKINTKTLQDILNACEKSFSTELNVSDFYGEGQTTWSIPEIGLAYKNTSSKKDLLLFVENLTETKSVRQAYAKIYEEVQARSSTTTERPEYKEQTPSKTTLDKDESAQLIAEAEARNKQKADIRESSDKAVQDALKRKQELIDKKIQEAINNKKVVVIPVDELKNVELTNGEKETILTFSKVAKEDPTTLEQFIEAKIKESLTTATDEYKENITPEIITKSAASITENFNTLPNYQSITEIPTKIPVMHPASPFVALTLLNDAKLKGILTDEEVRNKVAEMSQVLALGIEAEANVNFAGTNAVFGENIASVFYGPADRSITQFEVAEDQERQRDNGVEIDIREVVENGKKLSNLYEKLKGARNIQEATSTAMVYVPTYTQASSSTVALKTSTTLIKALPYIGAYSGLKGSVLATQWLRTSNPLLMSPRIAGLIGNGGVQQSIILSSPIIYNRPFLIATKSGSFRFAIGTGKTAQGSMVLKTGLKIGQSTIISTTTATGTTVSTATGFFAKALTFIGGLSGWVTAGIGFIVGYLAGKIVENWSKIKNWFRENGVPIAATIGFGGLLIGGPGVGAATFGAGLVATGSVGAFASGTLGVLGFIGRSIGIAIATPVIITILIIPPLVAFIMLVINNSAYVVPPSSLSSSTGADNPYMLVTKTANPSKSANPTTNETTVAYTVEIRALKSTLTNIKIVSTECNVIKKNNAKISCPPEDIPELDSDLTISPTTPYSFTFFGNYDSGYSDALVFDTITFSADTAEQSNIVTEGSASVCFGECPQNCAKVVDLGDQWPARLKSNATIAISNISKYQGFTAKLCPKNEPVNLCYKPSKISDGFFAWHVHNSYDDNCDVYFNSKGVGSPNDASFIITHELTHHIQNINGGTIVKYLVSGGYKELSGNGFCTYSATKGSATEAMAEAAALYVNSTPSWSACAGNYSSKYPKNFSWAQKFMTQ